jgi:hypothetical protein
VIIFSIILFEFKNSFIIADEVQSAICSAETIPVLTEYLNVFVF